MIEKIPLPELNPDNLESSINNLDNLDRVDGIKVLNGYLIVFVSKQQLVPTESSSFRHTSVSSHYYICDLSQKQKKFEKISLDYVISCVDRSDDEIAILSIKGEVSVYILQDKKLVLEMSWKILPNPPYFTNGFVPYPFIYTKNNHQMVLGSHLFLYPMNENELKIIPLFNQNIVGVIKLSQYRGERLLMIREDSESKIYGWNGLYTFKQ